MSETIYPDGIPAELVGEIEDATLVTTNSVKVATVIGMVTLFLAVGLVLL